jgi:adenylate cyclase
MGVDDSGTLAKLKYIRRQIVDPAVAEYGGRIFNTAGDSILIEFPSAVDAVRCSIKVQHEMHGRKSDEGLNFRVGINLGDVIIDGTDIFGDGVNLAARLESSAQTGGIAISDSIHEQIFDKLSEKFRDAGHHSFKNIDRQVRVWKWTADLDFADDGPASAAVTIDRKRPAIAVLPFHNLSSNVDDEYFSNGLTEDIITALTYWRSFPVIARNSSFAFKDTNVDVRTIGRELGARYVLEGSVRRQGTRVRATAQLIDCDNAHNVWAEKLDRDLQDIFHMQDDIVQAIASVVAPELDRAELRRLSKRQPDDLDAWDLCIRAKPMVRKRTQEETATARSLFIRAIDLQSDYSDAHAGLAMCWNVDVMKGYVDDVQSALEAAVTSARRAVEVDPASAWAHHELSTAYQLLGRTEEALEEARTAVALNPNDAYALHALGNKSDLFGDPAGISLMEKAQALCPVDACSPTQLTFLARALLNNSEYEKSIKTARDAIRKDPELAAAHFIAALAFSMCGEHENGRTELTKCESISPNFLENRRKWQPYRDTASNERLNAALNDLNA